jgi:hypothetical protein
VLERAVARMVTLLRRRGALDEEDGDEHALEASAVSGHTPPAGPQWLRGLSPLEPRALHYDKPLCASLDGFTLHAATRAGAADTAGREALLRYVLRPPIAEERIEPGHGGLVRIALERAFADGTIAVEMDPLSLLCRLAASVPPPRYHLVKYAGVLASASPWRSRIGPRPAPPPTHLPEAAAPGVLVEAELEEAEPADRPRPTYRAWADLLRRTFQVDVLECPTCKGRMKLLAVVTHLGSVRRYLAAAGETTDLPGRSPSRGPPYWKSTVLRRKALEVA